MVQGITMIANTVKAKIREKYKEMKNVEKSQYKDFEIGIQAGITLVFESPQEYNNVEVYVVVKDTSLEYYSPESYTKSLRQNSSDMYSLCEELEETLGQAFDCWTEPYDTGSDHWRMY